MTPLEIGAETYYYTTSGNYITVYDEDQNYIFSINGSPQLEIITAAIYAYYDGLKEGKKQGRVGFRNELQKLIMGDLLT